MKILRTLTKVLVLMVIFFNFTSCNKSDGYTRTDIVNPSNVFKGDRLRWLSEKVFFYNEEGFLTKIKDFGEMEISFEYQDVTRAVNEQRYVRMTIEDLGRDNRQTYDMEIGNNGFVKYCEQTDTEGKIKKWNFEYTSEGYLSFFERKGRDGFATNLEYENGNVIKSSSSRGTGCRTCRIYYTSDEIMDPIENIGGIMLYEEEFDVYMENMNYAFYAGLLGKATRDLPVWQTHWGTWFDYELSWTLNEDGYPTNFTAYTQYFVQDFSFIWEPIH